MAKKAIESTFAVQRRHVYVVLAFIALVVIGAGIYLAIGLGASASPEAGSYQAVTLSNGEVYFGKAANRNGASVTLREVYYLKDSDLRNASAGEQITLVKLGNEAHGPNDQLEIPRENILYIEDLSPDSKFVKAISNFKQKNESE